MNKFEKQMKLFFLNLGIPYEIKQKEAEKKNYSFTATLSPAREIFQENDFK